MDRLLSGEGKRPDTKFMTYSKINKPLGEMKDEAIGLLLVFYSVPDPRRSCAKVCRACF
jgi:hypothetical protein